ncbi:MAG: GYD domain-containing protein [Desulfobacterales bacterium]|jgi:uncharacterized protein with GYD domain|nr:GYD domain-containing protein [Desulfobacterales bacterium]
MATFFMFGRYTTESIKKISAERTQQAVDEIRKMGGEVNAMHVLLGEYDLVICVKLAGIDDAVKASVALARLTGIAFTTCPAVEVETFDRLIGGK